MYIPVVYNIYNIIFLGMGIILMELAQKKLDQAKAARTVIHAKQPTDEGISVSTIPPAQPPIIESDR